MTTTINASNSGSGGLVQTADASGVLALQTAGTTAVTIDASQNVGIGTTSPSANLEVKGASGQNIYVSYTSGSQLRLKSDSGDSGVGTTGSTPLLFLINNGEVGRFNTSGNLLVGTTSLVTAERLNVTSGNGSGVLVINRTDSIDGNQRDMVLFRRSATGVGSISCSNTATAYNTSSDYRLKEAIAPMTGALAKVALLKPCTYKWKVDGSDGQGFIAHELAEVVPGCVTGEKDAVETYTDEDGNEATRPAYQGIDTSFLVATLTAAIQEQQALITSLTARIAALEGTPA